MQHPAAKKMQMIGKMYSTLWFVATSASLKPKTIRIFTLPIKIHCQLAVAKVLSSAGNHKSEINGPAILDHAAVMPFASLERI